MRRLAIVLSVALGGSALVAAAFAPSQEQARTVAVDISCPASGAITVTVNPWRATVAQGQAIEWVLQGDSDSLVVEPKQPGAQNWPYQVAQGAERRRGIRGGPRARYQNMRANPQRGRRYQYNIRLWCVRGTDTSFVLVDPDVVVGED